jgi:hypothetical protein
MINVYLDNAIRFERLAAEEPNTMLKTEFEKRANAYRKLCPSSDNLRLIRRFAKGGSGSSGVRV